MNKTIFSAAIAAVLIVGASTSMSAKSWRIHNMEIYKPHFTDINAAMASEDVQDGDTLYLDPGCTISGTQNVTKQVTIVGAGYFMKERQYGISTISGALYMKANNSKIEGVYLSSYLYIAANEVTVERCRIKSQIYSSGNNAQNATIKQCYLSYIYGAGSTSTNSSDWRIEGCIVSSVHELYCATIVHNYLRNTSGSGYYCLSSLSNCVISDNILHRANNSYRNNVFYSLTNCSVVNNILSCDEGTYTAFPNNICMGTNDFSQVLSLTNDDEYVLVDDSPAINYAIDGTDCGPTGGEYPYVTAGLPYGHPYYTRAVVGSTAIDGKLNVSLKVKMQDE